MPIHSHTRLASTLTRALAIGSLTVVGGCATLHKTVGNDSSARPAAVSVDGATDWAWDVSGDAVIRPLQVFTLHGKTYFQMLPRQRIPAVLVNGQPIPYAIAAPYIVLQGTAQRYDLMADGYRAVVVHRGALTMPDAPDDSSDRVDRVANLSAHATEPAPVGFVDVPQPRTRVVAHPVVGPATVAAAEPVDTSRVWRIDPSQKLLSHALAEWAKQAGAELVWKSEVDLPIRANADYHAPKFFAAMSDLLADASNSGYRFFYAVDGRTVTVVSIKS